MTKSVFCGTSQSYWDTASSFSGSVDAVLDFDETVELCYGRPVLHPADIGHVLTPDTVFVIAPSSEFKDLAPKLETTYHVPRTQIVDARTWALEKLKGDDMPLRPFSVNIDASSACQLSCPGCYMRLHGTGVVGTGHLTFENFKVFVDDNPFVGHIELSNNGEPFLNPELHDILVYARKKMIGIGFGNGTNFNHVPDQILHDLVDQRVWFISISIDGTTQDVYEQYRRGGNLDTVLSNIAKINELKDNNPQWLPQLEWKFVVMDHNQHQVLEAKQMASDLGMSIKFMHDWRGPIYAKDPDWLHEVTGLSFPRHKADASTNERPSKSETLSRHCAYCYQLMHIPHINWDGKLLGCCTRYRNYWDANVFEQGFVESINSGMYREHLIAFLENRLPEGASPCADCIPFKTLHGKGMLPGI